MSGLFGTAPGPRAHNDFQGGFWPEIVVPDKYFEQQEQLLALDRESSDESSPKGKGELSIEEAAAVRKRQAPLEPATAQWYEDQAHLALELGVPFENWGSPGADASDGLTV